MFNEISSIFNQKHWIQAGKERKDKQTKNNNINLYTSTWKYISITAASQDFVAKFVSPIPKFIYIRNSDVS